MKKTIQAFYVPGLGDPRYNTQGWALKLWRLYGVQVHYYPMYWSDNRSFASKFDAFLAAIDEQVRQHGSVSLIGTSAGASAVLNAYAARKDVVDHVVCISGKINHPQAAFRRFTANPSFGESLGKVTESVAALSASDRSRILSLHPIYDDVVPVQDTIIEGAHEGVEPVAGHVISIAYALTLGSWRIAKFLKS